MNRKTLMFDGFRDTCYECHFDLTSPVISRDVEHSCEFDSMKYIGRALREYNSKVDWKGLFLIINTIIQSISLFLLLRKRNIKE